MESLDLQDYIKPLLRWWWLLLIATVLAALASYFYTIRQPNVYTSQATLLVGNTRGIVTPDQSDIFLPQLLAETYADIGMKDTVRQATMDALDMSWLPFYWIQALPNSPFIEVTVSAEIPELSQAVANELGTQLILQGPDGQGGQESQQFIANRLTKLETDIANTEEGIERNRAKLADLFSAREIATVQDEIAALDEKLDSLNSSYIDLLDRTTVESPNTINVIERASLPIVPDPSNLWLNILLAAAVGFVLASGGAYLLEYLDDTVKSSDDIKKQFDLATLTAIPAFVESKANVLSGNVAVDDSKLVMLSNPQSPYAEAFRILRTNLQFADVNRRFKYIMITSPEPGDGKSTTIANLGIALAQAGRRVIIIDADLHRPTQHQVFQVPNNMGVTTALFGGIPNVTQMLHQTRTPGLRVLTSGPLPPNPSELLGSDLMEQLLGALDQEADIILLDTPPATILIDAAALSVQVDAVVLVVRAGKTSRATVKKAVEALRQVRARIAGVILNGVSIQNTGYHYNYSQYGYNRYGHSAPVSRPPGSQQPGSQRRASQQPPKHGEKLQPPSQAGTPPTINGDYRQRPRANPHSGNNSPWQGPSASIDDSNKPPSLYAAREGRHQRNQPHQNAGSSSWPDGHQNGLHPHEQTEPRGDGGSGYPYGYASSSPAPKRMSPQYGYAADSRTGVTVENYGRVQARQPKPPPKKGFGRFWRS